MTTNIREKIHNAISNLEDIIGKSINELEDLEHFSELNEALGEFYNGPSRETLETIIVKLGWEREEFIQLIFNLFFELENAEDIEIHELAIPEDKDFDKVEPKKLSKFKKGVGDFDGLYFKRFPNNKKRALGFTLWQP